MNINQLFGIVL